MLVPRQFALVAAAVLLTAPGYGGRLLSAGGGHVALIQAATFGPLVPHGSRAATLSLPVHLSIPLRAASRGYRVSAVASLVVTPATSGGKSLTAADIGVGILSVSSARGANTVAIAPGFDYDPAAVSGKNGAAPYTGAATGRAALTDLLSGREILRAEKMPGGRHPANPVDLDLTFKLAVVPQFFSPGSFSGTITLTVLD